MSKCEHDWVIYPYDANEDEHRLCPECRCWVPKQSVCQACQGTKWINQLAGGNILCPSCRTGEAGKDE